MRPLALARLLRLSLAPSALADVAAGLLVGGAGGWPEDGRLGLCFVASLGIYHGAMALNDWADRASDARTRPERPLPAGALSARTALALAAALLALGVAAGATLGGKGAMLYAGLAGVAILYDLAGRGPWSGPLLLGSARALNLAIPLLLARDAAGTGRATLASAVGPPAVYGLYVLTLSRLARFEDCEGGLLDPRRARRILHACAGWILLLPVTVIVGAHPVAWSAAELLACAGALGLWRLARADEPWTPALAGRATGALLRRLLVCSACLALASWDGSPAAPIVTLAILAGYPLSHALRRLVPPT